MKLWLISQGVNNGYDTYDSAVVAAETEREARETYPQLNEEYVYTYRENSWWYVWKQYPERKENGSCWASNATQVEAEYLGEAEEGTEAGTICASFNAG